MSVQFGRWNFDGATTAPDYIDKVSASVAGYGPDSDERYSNGGVAIIYRAFHTTNEAARETQPQICRFGGVITWDGRLDNSAELISEMPNPLPINSTDAEIAAAAYELWGVNCFAKLIGDWALSIWNPINRSLILAKDPIGTRHLYYSIDRERVTWSTLLDPLVLFADETFTICEEYIAGWFSHFPAAHLTPYVGIHSVPPSSYVVLSPNKTIITQYWDFEGSNTIRYRTNVEYEEHFRSVFAKAVQRRLRSDRPILADLSGGMDSTSIVCMGDIVIASGVAQTQRLDTISWYDDSNPALDELPYVRTVEQKRGRTGHHIDLSSLDGTYQQRFSDRGCDHFSAAPETSYSFSQLSQQYISHILSHGYRVSLCGVGGDEVMGGSVPSPTPELQDLLARARLFTLIRQLNAWAAKMSKARVSLLYEAVQGFFKSSFGGLGALQDIRLTPWFHLEFLRRNQTALCGYPTSIKLFGPLPSFQHHVATLDVLRRILAFLVLPPNMFCERRYPYLDRCLLEFMFGIPRTQIVGVGRRRSLMKRALVGIVPDEHLNRRPRAGIATSSTPDGSVWPSSAEIEQQILGSSVGIIQPKCFLEALHEARMNRTCPVQAMSRTLALEAWLRQLSCHGILRNSVSPATRGYSPAKAGDL